MNISNTEIGKINVIGRNKYNDLKSYPYEKLTEEDKKLIENYEKRSKFEKTEDQQNFKEKYIENLHKPKVDVKISVDTSKLYNAFINEFRLLFKKDFVLNDETKQNLAPILYYFSESEKFFECKNLTKLSEPSFEKGLLIVGDYGNGKTSVMQTFESLFKKVPGLIFKGYSANEVVTMYEKCQSDNQRIDFERMIYKGRKYFDDVKAERQASNYGKVNIFKEIFEERYKNSVKFKTYITCNYQNGHPNDIQKAIDEFEDKYEGRVYDRIFEMFNIVEFKGKSFRK